MPFPGLFLTVLAVFLAPCPARAQTPPDAKPAGGVYYPIYRDTPNGKVLEATVTGRDAANLGGGTVLLKDFELKGLKDGQASQVQVIARAPQCHVNLTRNLAGDPGPVTIFTPTTNLFVQGVGFFCAQSNQLLVLSNQVETRVVKALLRSSLFASPKTGAPADAAQILKISSDHGQFDYQSNLVDYAGNVRVVDPQYQMVSPFLSIQFASNQTVETILAWDGVVVTLTNKGVATGATASYSATNGNEILELAGGAEWRNGQQQAKAAKFTYDPARHFLIADEDVRVRWPNPATNDSAPPTFRELFAGDSTLQMTPDGGLVDRMTCEGNVIIVNQADHSRAMAAKAVYDRTNDLFQLTGDASWWNDQMEVRGQTLSMAASNKIYHAQGDAQLKLKVSGAGTPAAGSSGRSTTQCLYISSDDIVSKIISQTNLVTFRGNVHARLLEGEQLQDTLTARLLLVYLDSSNQVQTVVAQEDVRAETAADATGVKKTLSCGELTARRSPATGLWRDVVARENVVMETFGAGPASASNTLAAALVTARFSSATNQIESAEAVGAVDFRQSKDGKNTHACGDHAVYALAPAEQIELTGHAWAQQDKFTILDADHLVWDLKSGRLSASGLYHIISTGNLVTGNANPAPP
jgi:lipopolysaccharide export system protein LptA